MRELIFMLSLACLSSAQAPPPVIPYLVRLERYNRSGHACSLVKAGGDFHLEVDGQDQTRVFEGQLDLSQLQSLKRSLDDSTLASLSQETIEEPLLSSGSDSVEISIFRNDHWQELSFRSAESRAPFEPALKPLLRWLTNFEKLPRRELSEDEAKNNCLPPKKLVLKRRDLDAPETGPKSQSFVAAPVSSAPSTSPVESPATTIFFGMFFLRRAGTRAEQSCMLVADNGLYRFENRVQPAAGKAVHTQISLGQMNEQETRELRDILDNPNLAKLPHHEPAGGLVVRMMGNMLRLSILRPQGVQEIILSSNQRSSGYFYTGDGDLSRAQDLLRFLSEHVESKGSENFAASLRNDCKELP